MINVLVRVIHTLKLRRKSPLKRYENDQVACLTDKDSDKGDVRMIKLITLLESNLVN